MAGRVDRDDADAQHARDPRRASSCCSRRGSSRRSRPGFDASELALTTELTRIMVLAPLFLAAGAVATSALNARGRFGAASIAPIAYNLGIIGGAIFLVPAFGVEGLAIGVVVGAAGHLLVQVPTLRRIGARIRPRVNLSDPQARRALVLMAPRALGLGHDPGRVPRDDQPRVDAARPGRSACSTSRSRSSRSRSASSACRWASSCCRRCRARPPRAAWRRSGASSSAGCRCWPG